MTYFYKKDGEVFIPEKINPDLVKLANAVIKATKTGFRLQLKSTSLTNALKAGKREQMLSIMQKCFNTNKRIYDDDMALTGVKVEEVEDSMLDHSFTNYVFDDNATEGYLGTETAKCDNCPATDTKAVVADTEEE